MSWESDLEQRKARLQYLLDQELIRRGVDKTTGETRFIDMQDCDIIDAEYWEVVPETKSPDQKLNQYLTIAIGVLTGVLLGTFI